MAAEASQAVTPGTGAGSQAGLGVLQVGSGSPGGVQGSRGDPSQVLPCNGGHQVWDTSG